MANQEAHIEPIIEGNIITYDTLKILVHFRNQPINIDTALSYDAVIVEGGDVNQTRLILQQYRSHHNIGIYLKPVFLLKGSQTKDPFINELIDGVIYSFEQVKFIAPRIQELYIKINEACPHQSLSFEAEIIQKLLNYLYTRSLEKLSPTPYVHSGIGYTYPPISANFSNFEEYRVLELLKIAVDEGLLKSEYYDRSYLCSHCSHGFLSFREVCPRCNSSENYAEDMIHHFPCGYVGPTSDFDNELDDQLNCPKCNKTLRHIGVDYDKPSVLYTCMGCLYKFQDFNVKAKCINCQQENDVEALYAADINNYTLTKKGNYAALYGYLSTSKDIEDVIGTIKASTFRTMVEYEIERLRQTEGQSNIAALYISNAGALYSKIGADRQREVLKEMVQIIRRNLRSADVISFDNANTILLLMNEIPLKVGDKILIEIVELMKKLVESNIKDFEIEIEYSIEELNTYLSHELQIQKLTNSFNKS